MKKKVLTTLGIFFGTLIVLVGLLNEKNIDINTINKHGAVSKEIAILMAEGSIKNSDANIAISVTGIAGPGGGTKDKPVGLVHMALAVKNRKTLDFVFSFGAKDRETIRELTTLNALKNLYNNI